VQVNVILQKEEEEIQALKLNSVG